MSKTKCPKCDGKGWWSVETVSNNYQTYTRKRCPACKGTGIKKG